MELHSEPTLVENTHLYVSEYILSDVYMHQWTLISLVQIMYWRRTADKQWFAPMPCVDGGDLVNWRYMRRSASMSHDKSVFDVM